MSILIRQDRLYTLPLFGSLRPSGACDVLNRFHEKLVRYLPDPLRTSRAIGRWSSEFGDRL